MNEKKKTRERSGQSKAEAKEAKRERGRDESKGKRVCPRRRPGSKPGATMNINNLCQPASSTKRGPSTTEIDHLSAKCVPSKGWEGDCPRPLSLAPSRPSSAFTWRPPCTHVSLQISPSHKDTTPMTSFNSITSVNSLSPNRSQSETPGVRTSTYEYWGGDIIQPIPLLNPSAPQFPHL